MTPLTPPLEARLLNDWQTGLPLIRAPYAAIARRLGVAESAVVSALKAMMAEGKVSRVGAVFRPGAIGASTLAALAVPDDDLERVAALVGACQEVNHAYEREHRYNLWLVVTAADEAALARALAAIEAAAGQRPIVLPLVADYWIDLAFDLGEDLARDRAPARQPNARRRPERPIPLRYADRLLATELEHGLPLTPLPYAELAARTGTSEAYVWVRLAEWLNRGVIRRLGIIVRHRPLGYTANAMCVWDVPDAAVDGIGTALAGESGVTLCYRRHRDPPRWPFNLFCMIHGRRRDVVQAHIERLSRLHGLCDYASAVLFSRRAFKQRGARYGLAAPRVAAEAGT